MENLELAHRINDACRLRGEFTLRSGQVTNEYFDKYSFESDPELLLAVAQEMVPLLPEDTELLGGLELGGVPLATVVSSLTGIRCVFIRKAAKAYGTCRLAEGASVEGKQVTLIEDVVTTGGAVRDATLALRERAATVSTVVCAIDRSEPGANRLGEIGVATRPVLVKAELDAALTL